MTNLTRRDLRLLLDTTTQFYHPDDLNGFRTEALTALARLVPTDFITYSETNLRPRQAVIVTEPAEIHSAGDLGTWARYMHQHPICQHMGRSRDGSARKLSDFLTQRQFQRLALYQEFYRPVQAEQQMVIRLGAPVPLVVAFTLSRRRPDFSERDRLLLNLLRPHLMQAYWNAETLSQLQQENNQLRQTVTESDRGVIVVKNNGRIYSCTERARHWLEAYCGRRPHAGGWLPVEVRRWFLQQRVRWTQRDVLPALPAPFVLTQEGRELRIRLLEGPGTEQHLLLLEERVTQVTSTAFVVLGLSRREAEVLYWLVRGKTNPEIGTIMQLRPSTVQTHVLRIYQKLGVETRVAAAMHALESLGLVRR